MLRTAPASFVLCLIVGLARWGFAGESAEPPDSPHGAPRLLAPGAGRYEGCLPAPGGTRLYCTRLRESGAGRTVYTRDLVGGRWADGVAAPFAGPSYDLDPAPAPVGGRLVFVSFRPPRWNMDLWLVDAEGREPARALPATINSDVVEQSPSLSATGALYFLRGDTIFRAPREGGTFGAPMPLPGAVNAGGRKFDVGVAPDESFLVYTSDRPGGHTAMDLYASVSRGGSWSAGVNLGPRINSGRGAARPGVTADGRQLCFSDERRGVAGLYCVETTAISSLFPSDVAGRWLGEMHLLFADGRSQRERLLVVLRQFGAEIEGGWGPDERTQNRFKRARLADGVAVLESASLRMRLTFAGESASGTLEFAGPGAPRAGLTLQRTVRGNGGATGPERRSVAGHVEAIEDFPMPELGRRRRLWVYLPPGYAGSDERYPVVYMQDGQNLFDVLASDRGEWKVDEAIEDMVRRGESRGLIVVGVEHGGPRRTAEYTPAWLRLVPEPEGDAYARFVAETLKPFVDARYRTLPAREHTAIVGSSAGAQIAFHIAGEFPQTFSKVGALGFAMGRGAPENNERWRLTHVRQPGARIYLHVTTGEGFAGSPDRMFVDHLTGLHRILREMGYTDDELVLDVEQGGRHDEAYWSARFPRLLRWLFGPEAAPRPRASERPIAYGSDPSTALASRRSTAA